MAKPPYVHVLAACLVAVVACACDTSSGGASDAGPTGDADADAVAAPDVSDGGEDALDTTGPTDDTTPTDDADAGPATDPAGAGAVAAMPSLVRPVLGGGFRSGPTWQAFIVVEAPLPHQFRDDGEHQAWIGVDPAPATPPWSSP